MGGSDERNEHKADAPRSGDQYHLQRLLNEEEDLP